MNTGTLRIVGYHDGAMFKKEEIKLPEKVTLETLG